MHTVLITGANRGIGLEHALRYAAKGVQVFAGVRDPHHAAALQKGAKETGKITVFPYDAADPHAPALAKTIVMDRPLDLLLANAGVYGGSHQSLGNIAADEIAHTIQVNTIAPLLLANALLGNVEKSERKIIAFQSSQMGSNASGGGGGFYAYRSSKAALNKIATTMASDVKKHGVIVVTLHPGWVKTDMGGANADISVKECVDGQQALFDKLTLAKSGGYFNYDGSKIAF